MRITVERLFSFLDVNLEVMALHFAVHFSPIHLFRFIHGMWIHILELQKLPIEHGSF